jgi:SAM-dependent methyltransferase
MTAPSDQDNAQLTPVAYGGTSDVRKMYEVYPFPSPVYLAPFSLLIDWLIRELIFEGSSLAGKKILDAGCGTGDKLFALCKNAPDTTFRAVDMTQAALDVAAKVAKTHNINNVTFGTADLMNFTSDEKYDVVMSGGVVHHLESPQRGIENLRKALKPDGVLVLRVYHALGEFDRMRDRELALTLWGKDRSNIDEGLSIVNDLGLRLDFYRYGVPIQNADPKTLNADQATINADAYLHPIVNTYRIMDVFRLLKRAGLEWAAIESLHMPGYRKAMDLEQVSTRTDALKHADVFKTPALLERFNALSKLDKLRTIELALSPTNQQLCAGMGKSYEALSKRTRGNVVMLSEV